MPLRCNVKAEYFVDWSNSIETFEAFEAFVAFEAKQTYESMNDVQYYYANNSFEPSALVSLEAKKLKTDYKGRIYPFIFCLVVVLVEA